jgi:alpha-1,6-mannosyltransferase
VGLVATSLVLFVATALLGPSAAQPTIPGTGPSRQFGVDPADWIVTVLMWGALLSGAIAVAAGWWALGRGWAPDPRRLRRWGFAGAAVMALLPPLGSTDIMSYGAYGRMVVLGLNPYTTTVNDLAVMGDPIGVTYQGDWPDVASVYGPVALGVQGLDAVVRPGHAVDRSCCLHGDDVAARPGRRK